MTDLVKYLRDCSTNEPYQDDADKLWAAADRISQQDAELERLRREVEEAREQARFAKASDQAGDEYIENMRGAIAALKVELAEARKAAFIEVAEMASLSSSPSVYAFAAMIRAKAEEPRT